jgi:dsRNA-specific ribonuclease
MADGEKKEKKESGSNNKLCVDKVSELVCRFVGVFGTLFIATREDLSKEADMIFSHRSRKDENEETNATMAWMGDKIYARALSEMLYKISSLKSTGVLTKYLNYYACAQFHERLCKYLGLDTLVVAAKQHEPQYPERSAYSKSSVLEALVCYIYRTVDETTAISFICNILVDFAAHNSFFPHRTEDEIPWDKQGNSWGLLGELVAQAAGPTGKVLFDVSKARDICMATVRGLTEQVVQATMPYHLKLLHKAAQEVLAVDVLRREDFKDLAKRFTIHERRVRRGSEKVRLSMHLQVEELPTVAMRSGFSEPLSDSARLLLI